MSNKVFDCDFDSRGLKRLQAQCRNSRTAFHQAPRHGPHLVLSVYTTTRSHLGTENNIDLVLNVEDFDVESKFERTVNVSVPKKTRNNGTLYAYIFLHHAGVLPWHDGKQVHLVSPLTTYMVPKPEEINLLTGESDAQQQLEAEKKPTSALDEPVSHWRPRLALNVMADNFVLWLQVTRPSKCSGHVLGLLHVRAQRALGSALRPCPCSSP
ncbi:PREDICTED: cleft lip and palate transmembrane protein 1-like protein [Mandrillus leucophaeus]|uniref:cleft lip and palate transmembrane protein 1-like protein n=1 Tax=Mandrillus leucophaeus TaxID=9568 RepID=UPI0005F4C257|nr:PREDICTED: cleft lip and palate transmembrane protein 1-like protein [Mandrillus leucophaeus]